VALQDHVKYTKQSKTTTTKLANQPKLDLSLKEGQTITVNIKTRAGVPTSSNKSLTSASNPVPFLRPPPSGKASHAHTQAGIALPPSNVATDQYGQQQQTSPTAELWGDFVASTPNQAPAQFNNANYNISVNTNNPNNSFNSPTNNQLNQLPTLTPAAPKQPAQNTNPFAGLVDLGPQTGAQPQQSQPWFSQPAQAQPAQGQNPWFLQNQSTPNQTTQPTQQSGTQQPWFL